MKGILSLGFCFIVSLCFSQKQEFVLKGRILAPDSVPVENAYIINYRGLLVYPCRENGQFNVRAQPGDSLMVYHISFVRKKVYADSVMMNPVIILKYDTVMIKQVDVGIDQERQNKNLEKNLNSIRNMKVTIYRRMNPGASLVNQAMTENIKVLRAEATSVSLLRFSPSKIIQKIKKNKKKSREGKDFHFYRHEKQKAGKKKE